MGTNNDRSMLPKAFCTACFLLQWNPWRLHTGAMQTAYLTCTMPASLSQVAVMLLQHTCMGGWCGGASRGDEAWARGELAGSCWCPASALPLAYTAGCS